MNGGCGGQDVGPARVLNDSGYLVLPDGNVVLPDGAPVPLEDGATPDPDEDSGDPVFPAPIDAGKAFDFAPPYVAALGPSSRSDAGHKFAANVPPSNPRGTICITCHSDAGTASNMPFFAGGSVRRQADSGPFPEVEVRLKAYVSSNAVSAYTDQDGNWFIPQEVARDAGVQFSVRPGVRNATSTRTMGPTAGTGVCNKCHIAYL